MTSTTTTDLRVGGPCQANGRAGDGEVDGHSQGHGHSHGVPGGHVHSHGPDAGHSHSDGHSPGHDHGGDGHSHGDDHPQGRQLWRPHTPPGAHPVLDIGGDIGALVVYLPELTASGELDVQPVGQPEGRFHTGVHDRLFGAGGDGRAWVAIFPEVVEGGYELLDDHGATRAQVVVAGGEVRELDLR